MGDGRLAAELSDRWVNCITILGDDFSYGGASIMAQMGGTDHFYVIVRWRLCVIHHKFYVQTCYNITPTKSTSPLDFDRETNLFCVISKSGVKKN